MSETQKKTLKEEDVVTEQKVGRRSLLSMVAGGVIGGAAIAVGMRSGVSGKPGAGIEGCTDNDQGTNSDPAGNGRGNGRSDNDQGTNSDPAGCARSPQR